MIKKISYYITFLLALWGLDGNAQLFPSGSLNGTPNLAVYDYGNDWYRNNLIWFKLHVWQDGLYRVTQTDLDTAGVTLSNFDPNNLHIYYRGEEIPLHVETDLQGNLNYFEFYGFKNDGAVDSKLYRDPYSHRADPNQQATPFSSIFTDTSAYFVTWDNNPGLRYQEVNSANYLAHSPKPYFRFRKVEEIAVNYFRGGGSEANGFFLGNSDYISGEGYTGYDVKDGETKLRNIATPGYYNSGNASDFQIRSIGVNSGTHGFRAQVQTTIAYTDTFLGIAIKTHQFSTNVLLPNTTQLRITATQPNPLESNQLKINWITIDYDRNFNLTNQTNIRIHSWYDIDTARFSFINVNLSSEAWLYDLDGHYRIPAVVNGTTTDFLIPGNPNPRRMAMVTDNALKTPKIEATTSLANLSNHQNDADFVIISHRRVANSANEYKLYRDTCTVNPHKARVVFVDQIYDEFGYGSVTPLAIKRFCKYTMDQWSTRPKYFLLWGKGLYKTRDNTQNLVPAWGFPASDYEYVTNFEDNSFNYVPVASIGRVNVEKDDEGRQYLEKVVEYEHMAYANWMKEAIYLGGGNTSGEQERIIENLVGVIDSGKVTISPGSYGYQVKNSAAAGKIDFFCKYGNGFVTSTNEPTEDVINRGAGLIHFFGHSGPNVFDVDLQDASQYTNWGKYPLMVAAGCYGGEFTESIKTFGERFVLEKNRGSIAYVANSTVGNIVQLDTWADAFYNNAFGTMYAQPLGDIMRQTIRDLFFTSGTHTNNILILNHGRQINLQGDPAVVLRFPTKPDLKIEEKNVFFETATLSAQDTSFVLNLQIENQGSAFADSFDVRIKQRNPQGGEHIFPMVRRGPFPLWDTLQLTLPNVYGLQFAGLNEFEVYVDFPDTLNEYFEDNNQLLKLQVINSNTPAIIYPPEFSVVPSSTLRLAASTYVMTAEANLQYAFEIDTVTTFDSPFKRSSGPINGSANYVEWPITFIPVEGQVYFWRVRLLQTNPAAWALSSFRYKQGKTGWAQARDPQFIKDPKVGLSIDDVDYEWSFSGLSEDLRVTIERGVPNYFLGPYSSNASTPPVGGIMYTAIDQHTLEVSVHDVLYGDWRFIPMPTAQTDLISAIQNTPSGDYFLIATWDDPKMATWSDASLQALVQLGGDFAQLRAVPNGDKMIFFGRKGDSPGQARVITQPNLFLSNGTPIHSLRVSLFGPGDNGKLYSTEIGPATDWREMFQQWQSLDENPDEKMDITVLGLHQDRTADTLLVDIGQGTTILSQIDAQTYPYMRLVGNFEDLRNFTAPQISEWEVLYGVPPDGVVDPVTAAILPPDTIQEGDTLSFSLQARNSTPIPMDSLLVRFAVERKDRSIVEIGTQRYADMPAYATIDLPYSFATSDKGLADNVAVIVEINPNNDQIEQYSFNNTYRKDLFVVTDQVGPILDVTFDGKHIIEGDIISPTPEIEIQLTDENLFLPMAVSDTNFKVWFGLGRAESLLPQIQISGNANIEAIPGKLPDNNRGRLIFRPGLLEDGEYTLKVQGYDYKGNESGKVEYLIHFQVVNEKAITQVLNYPNPFSSSTRFVYTLTGNELPYRFDIEIYTITGKLVKVIDLLAMGEVQYGYNISDYAWDGKDEFGDPLANGVYIYKAVVRFRDRSDHKLRDEDIEDYFNNGYGKMYLMR